MSHIIVTQPVGGLLDPISGQRVLTVTTLGGVSFQWFKLATLIVGATLASYTATAEGVYRCVVTNELGGIDFSDYVNVGAYPGLLDGYLLSTHQIDDEGIRALFSSSRKLIPEYTGPLYTEIASFVSQWHNQIATFFDTDQEQPTAGLRPATAVVNTRTVIRADGINDNLVGDATNGQIIDYYGSPTTRGQLTISLVMRSLQGLDTADPFQNDLFFGDSGGNQGGAIRQAPGLGNSTLQLLYKDDILGAKILNIVAPTASLVGAPLVVDYKFINGVFSGRANGGAWTTIAAPNEMDGTNFPFALIGAPSVLPSSAVDLCEVILTSVPYPEVQALALATGLLNHLKGFNTAIPWAATLPAWGVPWRVQIPLEDETTLQNGIEVSIQRDNLDGHRARLSADNPDWYNAFDFTLNPGDLWIGDSTNRVEYEVLNRFVPANGTVVYGAFDFWLDPDNSTSQRFLFHQWHAASVPPEDVAGVSGVLSFRYAWNTPGNLSINTEHSITKPAAPGQVEHFYYDAPISLGILHRIVYRWLPDPGGIKSSLEVWLDGNKIVNSGHISGILAADEYYNKGGMYNGAGGVTAPCRLFYFAVDVGSDSSILNRVINPRPNPLEAFMSIPLYNEVNPGQIFRPGYTIRNFPTVLVNDLIPQINTRLASLHVNVGSSKDYVIASGIIAVTGPGVIRVDTEGAAAADDLDTINGTVAGDMLYISSVVSTRDVTLKNGTGNMKLASDFILAATGYTITLLNRLGTLYELSRSANV